MNPYCSIAACDWPWFVAPNSGPACYTSAMETPLDVTFYTRPGCHLCEEAFAELQKLSREFALRIKVVDIMADAEAHARWWAEIPVITAGRSVLRAPIDRANLRRMLRREVRASA